MDAVARLDVGLVGDLARDRRQEAGLHVQRALRLARRPGRVRKQVRMFRIDLSRGQTPIRRRVCDEVIPKAIATEGHREVVELEPPPDDGVRHRRRALQRLVGDLLHRHDLAAAERTVGRDQRLRLGVCETRRDRRRGEAGEDRHLHGSEVRARVRRDRDLRRHRQVDPNRVALADPDRREPLGQPVDGVRQLAPRERDAQPVLRLPDRRLFLRELPGRPAVDTVPRQVELPADEPPGPFGTVRCVDDLRPRLGELEAEVIDHGRPEAFRLLDRDPMEVVVALDPEAPREPGHVGAFDLLGRRRPDEVSHARRVRGSLTCRR